MKVSACGYEADIDSYQMEWFSLMVQKDVLAAFLSFMNDRCVELDDYPQGAWTELMKQAARDFIEAHSIEVPKPLVNDDGHELWLLWVHLVSEEV